MKEIIRLVMLVELLFVKCSLDLTLDRTLDTVLAALAEPIDGNLCNLSDPNGVFSPLMDVESSNGSLVL